MVVDVAKLPFFYHGYPQKMKNTRWEHTSDMTGGQASICRTHVLYLTKNALASHIDKLIQSDSHMRKVTTYTASPVATPFQGSSTQFTHTFTPANMNAHLLKSMAQSHHNNSASGGSDSRSSCKCTSGCGKNCGCVKDGSWCDASCGCGGGRKSGSVCGNPTNLKLTSCARHRLLASSSRPSTPTSPHDSAAPSSPSLPSHACSDAHHDPNKIFKLPCKCSSASLADLVSEYECAECGSQFFYSFCFGCVVPVGAIWHCDVCGECRDSREFHCNTCNKCSYASPNNACRNCAGSSTWERSDCVIC